MAKLNCVTVLAPAKLNLALDVVGKFRDFLLIFTVFLHYLM